MLLKMFFISVLLLDQLFAAAEWQSREVLRSKSSSNIWLPLRIVWVKKLQPSQEAYTMEFSEPVYNNYGFLKFPFNRDVEWSFKLNKNGFQFLNDKNLVVKFKKINLDWAQDEISGEQAKSTYFRIADMMSADVLVYSPPSDSALWGVLSEVKGELRVQHAPGPVGLSPESLYSWITDQVQFNAMVVGKQGDLIVVASHKKLLAKGKQGVIYKRMAMQVLTTDIEEATSLIECVSVNSAYGLFKLLISKNVPKIGDKVYLTEVL